jgi:hypothetical protein
MVPLWIDGISMFGAGSLQEEVVITCLSKGNTSWLQVSAEGARSIARARWKLLLLV